MSNENSSEFQYVMSCLDSLAQKRYSEALQVLGDGLRSQMQSPGEVDGRLLLKHMNTLVSYLEHRLEEDFSFSVDQESAGSNSSEPRRCAFCGAEENSKQLIDGPTSSICADCIKACAGLIDSE